MKYNKYLTKCISAVLLVIAILCCSVNVSEAALETPVKGVQCNDYRGWAQDDPRWYNIKLNKCKSLCFYHAGCAVVSYTKLLIQAGVKTTSFLPSDMNTWMKNNSGYTDNTNAYADWKDLANISSMVTYGGQVDLSNTTDDSYESKVIMQAIKDGYYIIVGVNNNGHWVVVDNKTSLEKGYPVIWDTAKKCSNPASYNIGQKLFGRYDSASKLVKYKVSGSTLTMQYHANGAVIPGSEVKSNTYKVVTSDGLNLRSGAGTSYSALLVIPKGSSFTVTETKSANGYTWGKTKYNGKTGWCVISKTGWATLTGSTPVTEYYLKNGMVYKSASNTCLEQTATYGTAIGSKNGLWDYTSFGLVKEGYSFLGWSTNSSGTPLFGQNDTSLKPEDIATKPASGNKTVVLYAVWKKNTPQLTIQYNANGGTITAENAKFYIGASEILYNKSTGKIVTTVGNYGSIIHETGLYNITTFAVTKDGYKFKGWSTNTSGTPIFAQDNTSLKPEDIYPDIKNGSKTITMYAIWEKNTPTATFTPQPTIEPTKKPTEVPTIKPTVQPTEAPFVGKMRLEYEQIDNDTYKVYICTSDIDLSAFNHELIGENATVESFEWEDDFVLDYDEHGSLTYNIEYPGTLAIIVGTNTEITAYNDKCIAEVVVKLNNDSEKLSLIDMSTDELLASVEITNDNNVITTEVPDSNVVNKGDVNLDGNINAADALLALKHAAVISELDEDGIKRADVVEDGRVDSVDALQILKYAAGIIDSF